MKTWTIGGVTMTSPVMLGAGVCKTPASVHEFDEPDLPIGALSSGSYTPHAREGNKGGSLSGWVHEIHSGLNSYGMPNCGFESALREFSKMRLQKPLVVSIAGFSPEDYDHMLNMYLKSSAFDVISAIELNLGCPNAHDNKTLPVSYDLESLEETLKICGDRLAGPMSGSNINIWIKLSPYLLEEDLAMLSEHGVDTRSVPMVKDDFFGDVSGLIAFYGWFAKALVCTNTIPNCRYKDERDRFVTTPNDGQAGLSGNLLKSIALRQTSIMRDQIVDIDIIGCGGILNGQDVVDLLKRGASGVQCSSLPYFHGGPKAFGSLFQDSTLIDFLSSN